MTNEELTRKNEAIEDMLKTEDGKYMVIHKNLDMFLDGKLITNRQEMARNINFTNRPIIQFDLDKMDSGIMYGQDGKIDAEWHLIQGSKVRVLCEHNGHEFYEDGEALYCYDKKVSADRNQFSITIKNYGSMLSKDFYARDLIEMVQNASAPIIHEGEEINIVFYSRKFQSEYGLVVGKVKNLNTHCFSSTMATIEF